MNGQRFANRIKSEARNGNQNIGGINMKKKIWTGILAAVLVFSIGSTTAPAAAPQYLGCRGRCNAGGIGESFVDENGDGICDNYASGACRGGYGRGASGQGSLNRGSGLRNSQCQ